MKLTIFLILLLPVFFFSCNSEEPKSEPETKTQQASDLPQFNLEIPEESQNILDDFVKIAIKQKVITQNLKKYVPAIVHLNGKDIEAKIRLKGDWTDHIKTDKWSFRIKLSDENTFLGKSVFSIQSPHTRSYIDEWLMHEMMKREGVLTTDYQFIKVEINGKEKGIYAFEEHFTFDLLTSQNRKVGPMMKVSEDGYWEITAKQINLKVDYGMHYPIYESCIIEPFESKATFNSEELTAAFE